jgi:hypothetical protein
MLVSGFIDIPIGISLGVIALILAVAVVASLLRPRPPVSESAQIK